VEVFEMFISVDEMVGGYYYEVNQLAMEKGGN